MSRVPFFHQVKKNENLKQISYSAHSFAYRTMDLVITATLVLPKENRRSRFSCVVAMPDDVKVNQLAADGTVDGVTVKDAYHYYSRCSKCYEFHLYNLEIESVKWNHSADSSTFEECIFENKDYGSDSDEDSENDSDEDSDESSEYEYSDVDDGDGNSVSDDRKCPFENIFSYSDFSISNDPHWNCYCKTQKVCGCGCDPLHDGWAS